MLMPINRTNHRVKATFPRGHEGNAELASIASVTSREDTADACPHCLLRSYAAVLISVCEKGVFNLSLKGQQSADMQKSSVVVVADKTSLKRPFVFANAVHMVGEAFMIFM